VIAGDTRPPFRRTRAVMGALGLQSWRPILIEELAALLVDVALQRAPLGEVLEGTSLWPAVDAACARLG
jgi:hypothetical protein